MREDGKSKGLAFVKFTSKNSYNKALELNGTQHLGRDITIEPSLPKKNSNRNRNNHQ
jgi:RNA recognition motif-containing protein